ncbi:MAG: YdcH family protein [Burkholderiales bacterium]
MDEVERAMLEQRIVQLKTEHRDLDDVIKRFGDQLVHDQLQMQRLKRRKLLLKDQIAWLERQLDPDVPA